MAKFARTDLERAEVSPWMTVRDVAVITFNAHRAITDVEVLPATPRSGCFTVRIRTERPGQLEQAHYNCARFLEERAPVNVRFSLEELSDEPRPGDQMGLLG